MENNGSKSLEENIRDYSLPELKNDLGKILDELDKNKIGSECRNLFETSENLKDLYEKTDSVYNRIVDEIRLFKDNAPYDLDNDGKNIIEKMKSFNEGMLSILDIAGKKYNVKAEMSEEEKLGFDRIVINIQQTNQAYIKLYYAFSIYNSFGISEEKCVDMIKFYTEFLPELPRGLGNDEIESRFFGSNDPQEGYA